MKNRFLSLVGLLPYCLAPQVEADGYNALATGYDGDGSNTVYAFDTSDLSTPAASIFYIDKPDGITVSPDGSTAYFTSFTNNSLVGDVYSFPVAGPYTSTALGTGISYPAGVALSNDGLTGFATVPSEGTVGIYSFPISGGTSTLLTATSTTIPAPLMIVIKGSTAYVGDADSTNVYSFPVNDISYDATLIQSLPSSGSDYVNGLAISSDGYLYMAVTSGPVYRVSLEDPTGEVTQVSVAPSPGYADGLAVSADGTIVFMPLDNDGIYSFPTNEGFPQTPTFLAEALGIDGSVNLLILASSPSVISTTGLSGNNLTFAKYLNGHTPSSTIELFSSLEGSALSSALESAAPTRNAFAVFVAQNALFSTSQQVADHLQRERFFRKKATSSVAIAQKSEEDFLLVDAKKRIMASPKTKPCPPSKDTSVWVDVLGAYAHEKAQHQTPSFSATSGGVLAAMDYFGWEKGSLGGGLGYVYDYIHQGQGNGHASINQSMAVLYGELTLSHFYLNMGLWGGYYHIDQERHIAFSGVKETALSSPHGWQALPHLEMGGDFKWVSFTLEPFAMFDWANSWEKSFTEHGAPHFNASQPNHYSSMLRSEAGVRFYEKLLYSWGSLTFVEKGSYVNKAPFQTGSVTAFLVGSAGSFTVETLTGVQNIGLGQFEMIFDPQHKHLPRFSLSYQGEFSVPYQSHQISFIVEKQF